MALNTIERINKTEREIIGTKEQIRQLKYKKWQQIDYNPQKGQPDRFETVEKALNFADEIITAEKKLHELRRQLAALYNKYYSLSPEQVTEVQPAICQS